MTRGNMGFFRGKDRHFLAPLHSLHTVQEPTKLYVMLNKNSFFGDKTEEA
jgi:hypothetical protein